MKLSLSQNLKAILILILLAAVLWICFGPIQLGGPVSYTIISGNSMEPDFEVGDLVITRKNTFYQLNDQVLYNHPKIGYVFHRIVDKDQAGFILKGDNNDWLDSHQPESGEILGKYWFLIPGAGEWIRTLRKPVYFSGLAVIVVVIIGSLFLFPENESPRKKKGHVKHMEQRQTPPPYGDFRQEILFILGLFALAALAFGLISFTRPLTMSITDDVIYSHHSDLSYSAANELFIYDPSGVETGDPIYPVLTCKVEMDYSYHFYSPKLASRESDNLEGIITIHAEVSDPDGWNRSLLLVPEYSFKGSSIQASPMVDICKILDLINVKQEKTGTEHRWYSLEIKPEIQISGTVGGLSISDTYVPVITFNLGQTVFRLADGEAGFQQEQEGMLPNKIEVNNTLVIAGRQITVQTARSIAAILLGVCLLGSAYPAWSLYKDWKISSASRIQVQNQPLLVDVKSGSVKKKGQKVIEVATFQDLRKIAEKYGAMILHEENGNTHTYSIEDGTTLYQFVLDSSTTDLEENKSVKKI